jgi:predicted O-methyltransferase YrrM
MKMSKAPIPKFTLKERLFLFSKGIFKWDIPTYTLSKELIMLYKLSNSLNSSAILVEIGSYIGASSLLIAKAIDKSSKLYCVDTWMNDAMTEGNWDSFLIFDRNINSVKDRIIPIRSKSVDAADNFNYLIDFIFIDGDHSYSGVKADVEAWFPKLKPGGIIVMHDVGWAEGVQKVISEDIKPKLARFSKLPNMFWGWKE